MLPIITTIWAAADMHIEASRYLGLSINGGTVVTLNQPTMIIIHRQTASFGGAPFLDKPISLVQLVYPLLFAASYTLFLNHY